MTRKRKQICLTQSTHPSKLPTLAPQLGANGGKKKRWLAREKKERKEEELAEIRNPIKNSRSNLVALLPSCLSGLPYLTIPPHYNNRRLVDIIKKIQSLFIPYEKELLGDALLPVTQWNSICTI